MLAIYQTVFEGYSSGRRTETAARKNQENNDSCAKVNSKNGAKDLRRRGNRAAAYIYRDPILLVMAVWETLPIHHSHCLVYQQHTHTSEKYASIGSGNRVYSD